MELRRQGLDIEYYRIKDSLEVDFITVDHSGIQALWQVSLTLRDDRTREREVRAFTSMQEIGIKHATIVSLDREEWIKTNRIATGLCKFQVNYSVPSVVYMLFL